MKNLATIQKIKNVRPHNNSNNLELVDVLGWQVVTKKGEFRNDELAVYIAIDTVLPESPEFEFLRNKNFRIKPIRLRKEPSNGICFPLNILGDFDVDVDCVGSNTFSKNGQSLYLHDLIEGYDVTDWLRVIKYEKPVPAQLAGQAYGHIPGFLIITDEDNLRSYPNALPELTGKEYYITRKDDGSSGTFFVKDGEFGVCSRRIHLKEDPNNGFWRMEHKYNIKNAITTYFGDKNIAVQGEVVGPGVQGNPLGLPELEYHLFSIFDIQTRQYLSFNVLVDFCVRYSIPMVYIIDIGESFGHNLSTLIELANKQRYPNNKPAEGIVIRPKTPFYSDELKKSWSGKIINENYEEK
jgi:RNA ligase (TIGR02306 family)